MEKMEQAHGQTSARPVEDRFKRAVEGSTARFAGQPGGFYGQMFGHGERDGLGLTSVAGFAVV
jgi:hypothetical protein